MKDIHPAYGGTYGQQPAAPVPSGKPGECLGNTTKFQDRNPGDIVTAVPNKGDLSTYFLDPDMRIEGAHYLKRNVGSWLRISSGRGSF